MADPDGIPRWRGCAKATRLESTGRRRSNEEARGTEPRMLALKGIVRSGLGPGGGSEE